VRGGRYKYKAVGAPAVASDEFWIANATLKQGHAVAFRANTVPMVPIAVMAPRVALGYSY
jgi:hypothetical protein